MIIIETVKCIHVCPIDTFQHITSCTTVGIGRYLPTNVFIVLEKNNDTKIPKIWTVYYLTQYCNGKYVDMKYYS